MEKSKIMKTQFKSSYILSIIAALLATAASAAGLFTALYRDNTWVSSQLRGNDVVTLILGVPLLLVGMYFARRGSQRGLMVWLGGLWYIFYNYMFYLFGAAFNEFFLVYTAIFALSTLALIFTLIKVDARRIAGMFVDRTPVRLISGYMLFWAVFLGGLWIAQSVAFIFTGQLPQSVIDAGGQTNVVFAIDLSIMIPALILGAVWLWKRQPWGFIIAVIMNIKGATYAFALVMMGIFAQQARVPGAMDLVPLWIFFTAASLAAAAALLINMKLAESKPSRTTASKTRNRLTRA
jgi:hypothetical protein